MDRLGWWCSCYWLFAIGVGTLWFPVGATAQDSSLQLCLTMAANTSPIYPTQTFPSTITELSAVFSLQPTESFKQLESVWIAVDVGNAAPPNHEIAKATLTLNRANRGRFRYSQQRPLPVGTYRLKVLADGAPWKSLDFSVVPSAPHPTLQKPEDLFPLKRGQSWTYSFVQEAAPGAKLAGPGLPPGADKQVRANVVMTVAGIDQAGTHLEFRRDGTLVFEEWWQIDKKGLMATQRKPASGLVVLNPPQPLWALPLETMHNWAYTSRNPDLRFQQQYAMWGPVPLDTPQGTKPGYVVVASEPPNVTAERHWVPGVGLVKEIIIQAVSGTLVSRQEMTLTAVSPVP